MNGSATRIIELLDGAGKRYVIPVYQRKYDWKMDNCRQLYDDLKKLARDKKRSTHFFGSIVSSVVGNGATIEYHIIDGQQRLTTVTLLLLAMSRLLHEHVLQSEEKDLDEQILERFLISKWAKEDDKIKLRPVKEDREALAKLFGPEEDQDNSSNLTNNYRFFCELLKKEELSVDEIYRAIGGLEIISITLDPSDNAQMIFESLNSTGLALSEGDKIRNYVLMELPPKTQEKYYRDYWAKIEDCTNKDVSNFVRDYLSIKLHSTPNMDAVYRAFKQYSESIQLPVESLLSDMLDYARLYEKLLTCRSGFKESALDDCLFRMSRLEITVARPFFMEVLRLQKEGKISIPDLLKVFLTTESFLFRRNICDVPTNSLNKLFVNLNREIIRFENNADNYLQKFIYALRAKKESVRFPDDEEFNQALANKQVYLMRGRYKQYMFERFENGGTREIKQFYEQLDQRVYTIEHIMPQHLRQEWIDALGKDAAKIHEEWLHRLANLTLTAYNPELSDRPFAEKRDTEEYGYKNSGLRMNQKIAQKEAWGLAELEERNREMIQKADEIWACPQSSFIPSVKEYDAYTLDDESVDLTGETLVKYEYMGNEHVVDSWADMFERVIRYLHQQDKSVLAGIAYGGLTTDLTSCISSDQEQFRNPLQIDHGIYIEKSTSTASKISILRRLFALYKADPMDLVFYLQEPDHGKAADEARTALRRRYWEYALPILQKKNAARGLFSSCSPTGNNSASGFFRISGFCVICVSNFDSARVDFSLGKPDAAENKKAFDLLYSHKSEIESKIGTQLLWYRLDDKKESSISVKLEYVSLENEADWPRMAQFQADWSFKLCETILPYLQDPNDTSVRLDHIAVLLRQWMIDRDDIEACLRNCNRTYTRFMTKKMSEILPKAPGMLSSWKTENHYFYEIKNNEKGVVLQLAINCHNMPENQKVLYSRINELFPSRHDFKNYIIPFKTDYLALDKHPTQKQVSDEMDRCMEVLHSFEADLECALKQEEMTPPLSEASV